MATSKSTFDTNHEDMIHDSQLDYYGKRLATCSSDRSIKIFEDIENNPTLAATLTGHDGPVWQVAWAHPKFESVLASCSYDRKVNIWKEITKGQWQIIHQYEHQGSVNSISWAPYEFGLILACASSDCQISVHTFRADNEWEVQAFEAHSIGVNSISWAPYLPPSSILQGKVASQPQKMFVSGGCDNAIIIWRYSEEERNWVKNQSFTENNDWVRDVAWAPSIGLPSSTIAACFQDGKVMIYTHDGEWKSKELTKFPDVVWRVSWSTTGNVLAVAGGDNRVTLWKEGLDGEWTCISSLGEESSQQQPSY